MFARIRKPSGDARVSDLDRQRATARAEQLAAEGFIRGDEELKLRLRKIRLAVNQRQLDAALIGLEAGDRELKSGDLRASRADREDAIRRLEMHRSMGHLNEDEMSARIELLDASRTPKDIAKVLVDLPPLAAGSPPEERRISTQDRDQAIDLLEESRREGRITAGEHEAAKAQVRAARTRSEINAAFHGLSSPTRVAAAKTASNMTKQTTRLVAEGGRRARKSFQRALLAVAALMIGVILVIAGMGIGALICFVGAVLLFVSAATSLVTSRSSMS